VTEETILHTNASGNSRPGNLNYFVNSDKDTVESYKTAKFEFEQGYLVHLLKLCGGKASEAAKLAGKSRTDFYELLRKHGVKVEHFKQAN
jgi:two-component system, NtrC family, response regulator GlrR